MDSILRGFPIPAIFLHKSHRDGSPIYYVIDGKQRLESIFKFIGLMRPSFPVRSALTRGQGEEDITWSLLKREHLQHRVEGYSLQIIYVEGDPSSIIDLFIRINSTGRALNRQEQTHAKYFDSHFLKCAFRLADSFSAQLQRERVLSKNQISRMKHVELMSELMLSIHSGDVIHKKVVLETAMSEKGLPAKAVDKAMAGTKRTLNRTLKMFPRLGRTRFAQISDFYTLVVLVHKLERDGCVLTHLKRNKFAAELLYEFGAGVDELRSRQKRYEKLPAGSDFYRSYLMTVSEGTDSAPNRKAREKILAGLFGSIFDRKDPWRLFTPEQRRVVWQTSRRKKCVFCKGVVSWEDFTIDHKLPHSRGGSPLFRMLHSHTGRVIREPEQSEPSPET